MAWSTPRTWTTGEVPTAANLNTDFRDNFQITHPHQYNGKGQLIAGTGANAVDKFAAAENQVVVADSAKSMGWKFGEPPVRPSLIALFTGACPDGWSEYTSARGRAIVGVPASGTIEGTVGTALANLQDKTHTHTGPSHSHTLTTSGTVNIGASAFRITSVTTSADGAGATGTSALSNTFAYIQLRLCKKS